MADNKPPVSVSELVAKVTQSVTNIDKHRAAMADVAAQAKAVPKQQPAEGVTSK